MWQNRLEFPDFRNLLLAGLLLRLAAPLSPAATAEEPRAGKVEFSDGKVLAGAISLSPGSGSIHPNPRRTQARRHCFRRFVVQNKGTRGWS